MLHTARPPSVTAAAVPLVLLVTAAAAHAEVACPKSLDGHRPPAFDAVQMYPGTPAPGQDVAPTREGDDRRPNLWQWPQMGVDAARVTVVCRYEGTSRTVTLKLPPATRVCEQDVRARTFVCR